MSMDLSYCSGPKQTTYEEFCAFIEKRDAEYKRQTTKTPKKKKMNSGYCACPFKEFSEGELYERYHKMNENKPLQEKEMQTAIAKPRKTK